MTRSIAISLLPSPTTDEIIQTIEDSIQMSFTRTLPEHQTVISEERYQQTLQISLEQIDKSLLERYNLKWDRNKNYLMVLDKDNIDEYSEEEAEEAIKNLQEVAKTSGILSGKALKSLVANQ